jgi:ribonuclease P protein component
VLSGLNSREEFSQALKGPVVARTAHFVLHGQDLPDVHRLGCVLPKRWAKRAVTRNLLRRLILVAARQQLTCARTGAYVVRLRSVVDRTGFSSASSDALRRAMRDELQALFTQLKKT